MAQGRLALHSICGAGSATFQARLLRDPWRVTRRSLERQELRWAAQRCSPSSVLKLLGAPHIFAPVPLKCPQSRPPCCDRCAEGENFECSDWRLDRHGNCDRRGRTRSGDGDAGNASQAEAVAHKFHRYKYRCTMTRLMDIMLPRWPFFSIYHDVHSLSSRSSIRLPQRCRASPGCVAGAWCVCQAMVLALLR